MLAYLDEVELGEARKHLAKRRKGGPLPPAPRTRPSDDQVRSRIAAAIGWRGGMSHRDAALYLTKVRCPASRSLLLAVSMGALWAFLFLLYYA